MLLIEVEICSRSGLGCQGIRSVSALSAALRQIEFFSEEEKMKKKTPAT